MIVVDYALLVVLGLSAAVGLFRGFIKEALSLVTWAVAIWCAWKFGMPAGEGLPQLYDSHVVQLWLGRAVILVAVLITGGLLGRLLTYLTDKSGLTGTDRLVGGVFGLGRGILLAGLLVTILQMTGFEQEPWWQDSKLIPYAAPIAGILRDAAMDGIDLLQEQAAGEQI